MQIAAFRPSIVIDYLTPDPAVSSISGNNYGWLRAVREFVQSPGIRPAAIRRAFVEQAERALDPRTDDRTLAAIGALTLAQLVS
jgi:hypothetical protein